MNQKVLLGIVAVVVIVVAAYFLFFSSGTASGKPCTEQAMQALLPKITEAMTKLTPEEAAKIQVEAQEMMSKLGSASQTEACDMVYSLADKLKVQ